MDGTTQAPRITILLNLSSRLLCEALQGLLEKDAETYHAVAVYNLEESGGFMPGMILVDAATLEQSIPAGWANVKVVLVDTGLPEEEVIRLLLIHKLYGVISTSTDAELFRKALLAIRAGQVWIDNSKIKALLHNPPSAAPTGRENYSKKEREIILFIAEGCKNREIAARINISEQTVKTHISRILKKANVASRAQLAPLALKFKL